MGQMTGRPNICRFSSRDELCAESPQHTDIDRNSKTKEVRRGMESRQPEDGKDEIDAGARRRTAFSSPAPQDRRAARDHPDGGNVRE
jgi:hypothetical protein